jgi:hypothetical protein
MKLTSAGTSWYGETVTICVLNQVVDAASEAPFLSVSTLQVASQLCQRFLFISLSVVDLHGPYVLGLTDPDPSLFTDQDLDPDPDPSITKQIK